MNVLSLFDGMSCGMIALDQLGFKINKYYACEIDKYAIEISKKNYPQIIQLGDVTKIKASNLEKIDLLIGGSPCQDLSFANNKGKGLDGERSNLFFEFVRLKQECNPKYFMLENVRMLKEYEDIISEHLGFYPHLINSSKLSAQNRIRLYWTNIPNIKQPQDTGIVIKDILEEKVEKDDLQKSNKPIRVGTNIEKVKVRKHKVDILNLQKLLRISKKNLKKTNKEIADQIKMSLSKVEHWFRTDKSFAIPSDDVWFKLKDILKITTDTFDKQIMEFEYKDGVFESTQRVYSDLGKSPTITATNNEQMIQVKPKQVATLNISSFDQENRIYSEDGKSPTLTAHASKGSAPKIFTKPKQVGIAKEIAGFEQSKRVYSEQGKSPSLTTCGGGNREPKVMLGAAIRGRAYDEDGRRLDQNNKSIKNISNQYLELRKDNKSNTLTSVSKDCLLSNDEFTWRPITCLEAERLQTVPDNYTEGVSKTRRFHMLGNGWTVSVIKHIFINMENEPAPEKPNFIKQLNLFEKYTKKY